MIDIIINTFIIILAVNLWTLIGWVIFCFLDNFETTENHLLTCFFWFTIVINKAIVEIERIMNKYFE